MLNAIGNFISNNVGGIHSSEKRLKIFKYLKNNIHHKGFAFLRETGSLTEDEKKRKNDFKDPLFFFNMVVQNSCGVVIDLKSLCITDKNSDENGQLLITDTKVNDD